ncbi:MAG: ribbon-helix-helix domain-containing protein [archaeon]
MEALSLKLDENMLQNIDKSLKENNYSTRTEFIREAIRDKLNSLRREQMANEFLKFKGKANKKTNYEQNKITAQQALNNLAQENGW